MLARVSHIESFRRWRKDEEKTVDDLVHFLTHNVESEPMRVGTAFHTVLEEAMPGQYDQLSANGYTFVLPSVEMYLPSIREVRGYTNYGPLQVTGQVDVLEGKRIEDHKTTGRFDVESYLEGYQWRFYLDIFGADTFRWNVFERKELKPQVYELSPPHIFHAYRYPTLHADCMRLATEFYEFARVYMPPDYGQLTVDLPSRKAA